MGGMVLGSLNDFLIDADRGSFDFQRFGGVCDEAISYLRDHPNSGGERHIVISSLAASMIVFKESIPPHEFICLWRRVEATFNPVEQVDSELRQLVDCMIRTS